VEGPNEGLRRDAHRLLQAGGLLFLLGLLVGLAAWTANFLGAVWGAGSTMLPLVAGGARGSALQEGTIKVLLISVAASLITAAVLILWALRTPPQADSRT
jgi:hypothetical protein